MINFEIFSTPVVQSIGWTLVHSLWQGVIIAIVFSFVLILLNNERANIKYNISVIMLFFMFTSSISTFIFIYNKLNSHTHVESILENINSAFLAETVTKQSSSFLYNTGIDKYIPLIVIVWCIGLLFLIIRMIVDFILVHRLKSRNINPVNEKIKVIFNSISQKFEIKKIPEIYESFKVNVPMVIGFIKPVILLPVGVFTGFSSQEIETILAHELAHIRRNDYLVNIITSLIYKLYFYHPVVWWITFKINQERENSCDDMVLNLSSDRLNYAHALKKIYEFNLNTPNMAMAVMKNNNQVLKRIKRITSSASIESNKFAEFLILILIVFGLCIFSVNAQDHLQKQNINAVDENIEIQIQHSVTESNTIVTELPISTENKKVITASATVNANYLVNDDHQFIIIDSDSLKSRIIKLTDNLADLDSLAFLHDSLFAKFEFNFDSLDFNFNSIDLNFDSLDFDFNFAHFDSMTKDVNIKLDSIDFKFKFSELHFDSLVNDFNINLDSSLMKIKISGFKLDSLDNLIKVKLSDINFDTLSLEKSLESLKSLEINLDSLDFNGIDVKIKQMNKHLDSLVIKDKLFQKKIAVQNEKINEKKPAEKLKDIDKQNTEIKVKVEKSIDTKNDTLENKVLE